MTNFALRIIFVHTSKEFLTFRETLRHGADSFTSPLKEGVLRIFIALESPLPMVRTEPADLGPSRPTEVKNVS
jgi:hypothetical protein